MSFTYDLEWLNNKLDHKKVENMSGVHQIIILFGGYAKTLNFVLKLVIPI